MNRSVLFSLLAAIALHGLASSSLHAMEYVEICKSETSCKKFSRLIMGTDHLGETNWTGNGQAARTDEEIFAILDEAARLGINFFDTSPIYVGSIENRLGHWLKSREKVVLKDEFYSIGNLNPDRKLYALSKGGFPFDLYYSKKLASGTHSETLKEELQRLGVMKNSVPSPDGTTMLSDVPPGTYASRLYGSVEQVKERVSEEITNSSSQLNQDVTIYLMHRDDADFIGFKEIVRDQTPVRDIMEALSAPVISSKAWMVG